MYVYMSIIIITALAILKGCEGITSVDLVGALGPWSAVQLDTGKEAKVPVLVLRSRCREGEYSSNLQISLYAELLDTSDPQQRYSHVHFFPLDS